MATILSKTWLKQISVGRLGCKWIVCDHDQRSKQLVHPGVKALGKVWSINGLWAGTDGNSSTSLKNAQRGVESQVADAIHSDLVRLEEALSIQKKKTVVSNLTIRAIEVGMEEAILEGLRIGLSDCALKDQPILSSKRLPDNCFAGFEYGKQLIGILKPRIPVSIKEQLCHIGESTSGNNSRGVSVPFQDNVRYTSFAELIEACRCDASQCVVEMALPGIAIN